MPSRGSVQNIVRDWENRDPEVRQRDVPFRWHQLDRTRLPWEASHWVLKCRLYFESRKASAAMKLLETGREFEEVKRWMHMWEPFTNRWATWCWRVHQAAPDMHPDQVFQFAEKYVHEEQVLDLLADPSGMNVIALDDWLMVRLDDGPQPDVFYERIVSLGIIEPPPDFSQDIQTENAWGQLPNIGLEAAFAATGWAAARTASFSQWWEEINRRGQADRSRKEEGSSERPLGEESEE